MRKSFKAVALLLGVAAVVAVAVAHLSPFGPAHFLPLEAQRERSLTVVSSAPADSDGRPPSPVGSVPHNASALTVPAAASVVAPLPQCLPWYYSPHGQRRCKWRAQAEAGTKGQQAVRVRPPVEKGTALLFKPSAESKVRHPRFFDPSSFAKTDAQGRPHASLSFYMEGDPALPAPCAWLRQGSRSKTASGAAPVEGKGHGDEDGVKCWRRSCAFRRNAPLPCFSGCRCPIGLCRVVSVFVPLRGAEYTAGRNTSDSSVDERTNAALNLQEELRCVDNSALFAHPSRSFAESRAGFPALASDQATATGGGTPALSVVDAAKELGRKEANKATHGPLVCPATSHVPADALPSLPHWRRFPPNATVAELSRHDATLATLVSDRQAAVDRGAAQRRIQELDAVVAGRVQDLRSGGVVPPFSPTMPHAEQHVLFQQATASKHLNPRWRRWGGRCARPDHGGRLRGYHSRKDGFYRLENVCLGTGPGMPTLSGFGPRLERFEGSDEHGVNQQAFRLGMRGRLQRNVNSMLASVVDLAKPSAASNASRTIADGTTAMDECFLDTEAMLMPPTYGGHNHGHGIRMAVTMMQAMNHWFSPQTGSQVNDTNPQDTKASDVRGDGRDNTNSQGNGETAKPDPLLIIAEMLDEPRTTAGFFAPLLSRHVAYLHIGRGEATSASSPRTPGGVPTSRACFRSIVVGHVCRANGPNVEPCHPKTAPRHIEPPAAEHYPESWRASGSAPASTSRKNQRRKGLSKESPVPHREDGHGRRLERAPVVADPHGGTDVLPLGNQFTFRLHGRRASSDIAGAELFRSRVAACLGLPLRPARRRAPHVVYALRVANRFDVATTKIGDLARLAFDRGAGRFTILDFAMHEPGTFLRYFYDADVLLGPYGSALTWFLVMPPRSAVSLSHHIVQARAGWSPRRLSAEHWDYPGDAVAAGVSLLLPRPLRNRRQLSYSLSQLRPRAFVDVLEATMCAVGKDPAVVARRCNVTHKRLESYVDHFPRLPENLVF